MGRAAARRVTLALGVAIWAIACLVAPGIAGMVEGVLPKGFLWIVGTEALVTLALAYGLFSVLRGLRPSRWFVLAAPLGYLVSVALFFLLTLMVGGDMTPDRGYGLVVAADLAAATAGASAALLLRRDADAAPVDVEAAAPAADESAASGDR